MREQKMQQQLQGIFSKPAAPPPVVAPAVMPVQNDAAVQAAKQKQVAEMTARSGRQSTILTDSTDKLG